MVLWPGKGSGFAIPEKTGTGSVKLLAGESLRLVCLGSYLNFKTSQRVSDVLATCVSGSTFQLKGLGLGSFEDVACASYPTHTARRTGVACPNGELCEIGFDLGAGDFQRLITACHDDVAHNTILVNVKIPAVIDAAQKSFPRPGFVKGNFYVGISMSNIYTRVNQRATLAKILGSEELALSYIPTSGTFYLARGHLAAKSDFIYGSQQRATFYYLNTVPMWQNVNAGNWGILETNLRTLATQRAVDIDLWIGSIGVLELADPKGKPKEVYLHIAGDGSRAVPVPKLIFRVVWEKNSGRGVVFLTVNNPYLVKLNREHILCKDVSSKISYLTWNPTRSDRGLSYSCEVDEFRKVFPNLPAFKTRGLLV